MEPPAPKRCPHLDLAVTFSVLLWLRQRLCSLPEGKGLWCEGRFTGWSPSGTSSLPSLLARPWCQCCASGGQGPSPGAGAAARAQACGHRWGQSRSELPLKGCLCFGNGGRAARSLSPLRSPPSPRRMFGAGHQARGGPAQGKVPPCPSGAGPCAAHSEVAPGSGLRSPR